MQAFKRAHALPRISRNVGHPHLLPGSCSLAAFGHMVSKAQFPSTQKQQAPGKAGTGCAVTAGAGLALFVGQHIGALPGHLALYLGQFVKN